MFAYTCLSGSFLLLTCYKPKQRPDEKLQNNKNVQKHMSCQSLKLMIWLNLGRLLQQAKWMIALAEWHHIKEIYFMTFPEYMNCLNNIWVYWITSELSRQYINIFPCHLMIISAHKMPKNGGQPLPSAVPSLLGCEIPEAQNIKRTESSLQKILKRWIFLSRHIFLRERVKKERPFS